MYYLLVLLNSFVSLEQWIILSQIKEERHFGIEHHETVCTKCHTNCLEYHYLFDDENTLLEVGVN